MHTLRSLSEMIEREIKIKNFDVTPMYYPNSKELIELSYLCLDIIIRDFDIIMRDKSIKKLKIKKTLPVFQTSLMKVKEDLNENQRWSFWHFSILMIVTSISYASLGAKGKFKTVELNKQETWINPNHEVAIIAINLVAQKFYPDAMSKLITIAQNKDVDINVMCNTLLRNISQLK
jgi:hypothetical protein|tara:strand:- start:1958 stop:2485 length:528 start_codon:yes stop_codon:yes gene_type:complete